ncbi:TIGR04222 domain-containing membrane protein [Nocardia asiatica]|uniref:TIGR04222 domain-containing membrane protein n=1 Tax=Nocardia asiatica TaxID=209252 RepID=UPI003EE1EF85
MEDEHDRRGGLGWACRGRRYLGHFRDGILGLLRAAGARSGARRILAAVAGDSRGPGVRRDRRTGGGADVARSGHAVRRPERRAGRDGTVARYRGDHSAAAPIRALTARERTQLDPFTVLVYDRLQFGSRKTVDAIVDGSAGAVEALRTRMIDLGYLPGPALRHGLRDAGMPILVTGALGVVRVIAGASHGNPVGLLVALVVAQAICYWLVVRTPRLTALGVRARDAAKQRNGHLRPTNSPSYATYGAESAALAAAVFGIGALIALDPGLAQAVAPPNSSGGGGDSGGDGGGGGGGGCGGCGGCGG